MQAPVQHSHTLKHRCNLPRRFLDLALAHGHQFDHGQMIVCSVTDTIHDKTLFLAMNEFIDSPIVELPMDYLPASESVILNFIKQPLIAKKVCFKPRTSAFSRLADPIQDMQDFIVSESPCLNQGIDYIVNGCVLTLTDLFDKDDNPISYTAAFEHDINVEIDEPYIITPPPTPPPAPIEDPTESKLIETEHGTGLRLGGRQLSREEWLKRFENN